MTRPSLALLLPLALGLVACFEKPEEEDDDTGGPATGDSGADDSGGTDSGTPDTTEPGPDTGGPSPTVDLSDAFVRTGGCSDTFIWGTSGEESWALWFRDDSGIAEEAHRRGETISQTYDLSMDYGLAPSLEVQQGSDLGRQFCTDVFEEYTVDHSWWPVSGILTITVEPVGEPKSWGGYPAKATLELDGVTLESRTAGHGVWLDGVAITASVGWLPG